MRERLKNIAIVAMASLFLGGFMLWGMLKPDDAESVSERRPLAAFPEINRKALWDGSFMEDFEAYSLDQFPLRDGFRTVKAVAALNVLGQKDNNGLYIQDGFAAKLEYPMDTASMEYAASRFRLVYDKFLADNDMAIYFSLIPDKNYFMAAECGYPAMDYAAFADGMREKMDFAEYIDIFGLLELSDYYRTDSHWRQENIIDVAQHLAAGMGAELSGEYTVHEVEHPFYGVYYGQSALPLEPDRLCYLDNAVLENCSVFDYEASSAIPVYDFDKAAGNDPYGMFLSGSKSLLTIENPGVGTDRELIIFRDSFGSSIGPLLAEGYAKVTLVDIRYMMPNLLDRFISFADQDVLFLYSVSVLNNSETIK